MRPVFNAFSDLHRNLDRYDCNKLCKLLIESLMFNILFNSKSSSTSPSPSNQNNSKSGLSHSVNLGKSGASGYHNNSKLTKSQYVLPRLRISNNNSSSSNFSQHEYTLVLDLDETMVHYFFVRNFYLFFLFFN